MRTLLGAATIAAMLIVGNAAIAGERTVTLAVDNMWCAGCAYMVKQALAEQTGVLDVDVSYDDKRAAVVFDDSKIGIPALTEATAQAGFPSKPLGSGG